MPLPPRWPSHPILALKTPTPSKKDGWTYIHFEGTPAQIGLQHGYLLATQIADNLQTIELENTHEAGKPWPYFRAISHDQIMPHIEPEYLAELQGINHILMDGSPGLIHSGDDFGVNSARIMITETTLPMFKGWNPPGIPEFIRARKAMQYANNIDQFVALMREGNNGAMPTPGSSVTARPTRSPTSNSVSSTRLSLARPPATSSAPTSQSIPISSAMTPPASTSTT